MFFNNKSPEVEKSLQQNTGMVFVNNKRATPLWDRAWILGNLSKHVIDVNERCVLYNNNGSLVTLTSVLPDNWFDTCVKWNAFYFYKTPTMQTLTFIPTQPFTKFSSNQYPEVGIVWGPNPFKKHAIVTIDDTEYSTGFIISHHNLAKGAGFVPPAPVSYVNPNMNIDRTKITYLPSQYSTRKLAFFTLLVGFKSFLNNYAHPEVVAFETNNFYKVSPCVKKIELPQLKSKPQKKHNISFEQFFQKKTSLLIKEKPSTHLKKNITASNTDNALDMSKKQTKILSLEQRIKCILDYYSMWSSQQQQLATRYWLNPSNIYEFQDDFNLLLKEFLKDATNLHN